MSRVQLMKYPQNVPGYKWDGILGSGSFATVYKALKIPGMSPVAIKCVRTGEENDNHESAVDETIIMTRLKHENIVSFIDLHEKHNYKYIVMEFCNEGDLWTLLNNKHHLPESFVQVLMSQLASALKYLSDECICHMDLKPQNIFVTKNEKLQFKLGDFGLSQIISQEDVKEKRRCGTLPYMAPEIITHKPFDGRVDLWSVGIVMFECLYGQLPFSDHQDLTILEFIRQKTPIVNLSSPSITSSCNDVLHRLLQYDPNDRIVIDDLLIHDFIRKDYSPTPENYERVRKLIEQGSVLEKKKNYADALRHFKEGILYLECFEMAEINPNKQIDVSKQLLFSKKCMRHIEHCMDYEKRKYEPAITNKIKRKRHQP